MEANNGEVITKSKVYEVYIAAILTTVIYGIGLVILGYLAYKLFDLFITGKPVTYIEAVTAIVAPILALLLDGILTWTVLWAWKRYREVKVLHEKSRV